MSKTILITGASSGIGKETASLFSEKGYSVIATMRNPEKRSSELGPLKDDPNIDLVHLDVLDPSSINSAFAYVSKKYRSLDILLNNAGYAVMGAFEATGPGQIRRQFETNVFGLMEVTRAALPILKKQKFGLIINVSSMGGIVSFPSYSIYNSTKFALEGFSESLRYELEPFGIHVKLIEPSVVETDFYGRSMDMAKGSGFPEYDSFIARVTKNMADSSTAIGPRVVADEIFRAATDGNTKFRYPVGKDAKDISSMRKILPVSLFESFFRSKLLR